jgi:hypothetical protein
MQCLMVILAMVRGGAAKMSLAGALLLNPFFFSLLFFRSLELDNDVDYDTARWPTLERTHRSHSKSVVQCCCLLLLLGEWFAVVLCSFHFLGF